MRSKHYKENIQTQMQQVSHQLLQLQSSKHILTGYKAWNVFDHKKEALKRELQDSIEEYQRILKHRFNNQPTPIS
ncbi:MAG: hypothetical protein NTZ52_05255 [Chlamydiae bacterium]|nr:hypothetical protein [Chlamydiota bacterium]